MSQRQVGIMLTKTMLRYKQSIKDAGNAGPSSPGLQSQLLGQLTQEEK